MTTKPVPPPRYDEWLRHIFDRPEDYPGWYLTPDETTQLDATPAEAAALFRHTMLNCGEDLKPFTEHQVCHGLHYMIESSWSDIPDHLKNRELPLKVRTGALLSIRSLFADYFQHRCAPVLSHVSSKEGNALNTVCYMFWDITSLTYWKRDPDRAELDAALLDVFQDTLELENPACQESALHGLGHFRQLVPSNDRALKIVERYINTRALAPRLLSYAHKAAQGLVQ